MICIGVYSNKQTIECINLYRLKLCRLKQGGGGRPARLFYISTPSNLYRKQNLVNMTVNMMGQWHIRMLDIIKNKQSSLKSISVSK